MRTFKRLNVLAVAVLAFSAVSVADASAIPLFTASATGELAGHALEAQKFKVNGGVVECRNADIAGTITQTASTEQQVTVTYTECDSGGLPIHITPAIYLLTSNGEVHIREPITLTVTGGIFGECTITVGKQTDETVAYDNNSGKIKVTPNVTGISYTSTGGICGSSGTNGTYTGASEVERVGGGTISWDP